uniref:Uncharacterized protein n=2 Tax=Aegilops tauschii TaxID=37682 RepID=A0A453Q300_AEGTS
MKPNAHFPSIYHSEQTRLTCLLVYHAGTQEMTRKKKTAAARNAAQRNCYYLLQPGEANTPFLAFMRSLGNDIMTNEPPPGQNQPVVDPPARFIPPAQQGLFRVINMVLDIIQSGSCFEILHERNITFTEYFNIPKLIANNLKDSSAKGTKSNLTALAEMLDRVVARASYIYDKNSRANPEFTHLIQHIKGYRQGDSFFMTRYHMCTLPLPNRCFMYVAMYAYIMDILRNMDPEAFHYVISGLRYPEDWHIQCQHNTYLAFYYRRGGYDPDATLIPETTDPRIVPLRFHRNGPSHALEDAADPIADHGMRLTRRDLGHVLYFQFTHLMISMETSLHFLGALSHLDVQDLFPFHVRKN